ncbi:DUF4832 domain-containing protein [Nocardioides mangrovicus]|uniref:DUF4832 domain-containing protein n=1 Tax=Nocardioides mangrovicus TaxID=2478913 RepID=A0A3L8NWL4_9ACTN|nr:DUF4832 domain-containing protein [Nocardioides mangrovicus]
MCLAALGLGLVAGLATAPADAARGRAVTFHPRPLAAGAIVANTLRGEYEWQGNSAQPTGVAVPDTYYRDAVRWAQVEPTLGTFDDSRFEQGLADAAAKGGRFGFRVMAWCPGCWMQDSTVPSWLPTQGDGIPDWNSPTFISAWQGLMAHLGARYGDDPRLGVIDVGGYGKYGEWHTDGEGTAATPATMRAIISAVVDNFPRDHVVINASDATGTAIAMSLSPRIGLRADCLGAPNMYSLVATSRALQRRWRTAPVLSEWCHAGGSSTVLGARQVRRYHVSTVSSGNFPVAYAAMSAAQRAGWLNAVRTAGYRYGLRSLTLPRTVRPGRSFVVRTGFVNTGSAPTYDDWRLQLRLVRAGRTVATVPLRGDLRRLLAGVRTFRSRAVVGVPRGTYQLRLAVVDPRGYLAPMALATAGRTSDGAYRVGRVRVR